ncbi:MAG: hypothetical protein U0075_18510, partial [Thermomicrobiales bacterium]
PPKVSSERRRESRAVWSASASMVGVVIFIGSVLCDLLAQPAKRHVTSTSAEHAARSPVVISRRQREGPGDQGE